MFLVVPNKQNYIYIYIYIYISAHQYHGNPNHLVFLFAYNLLRVWLFWSIHSFLEYCIIPMTTGSWLFGLISYFILLWYDDYLLDYDGTSSDDTIVCCCCEWPSVYSYCLLDLWLYVYIHVIYIYSWTLSTCCLNLNHLG